VYAQTAQCRSIAFPVFGTGNLEYPWDEVANTMIDTINKYGRMHYDTTIGEVKIVLFDKDIKSIQVNIV
jgi:O-acetyl-ADP-ribose deacetylase (regulator of RNase III)